MGEGVSKGLLGSSRHAAQHHAEPATPLRRVRSFRVPFVVVHRADRADQGIVAPADAVTSLVGRESTADLEILGVQAVNTAVPDVLDPGLSACAPGHERLNRDLIPASHVAQQVLCRPLPAADCIRGAELLLGQPRDQRVDLALAILKDRDRFFTGDGGHRLQSYGPSGADRTRCQLRQQRGHAPLYIVPNLAHLF